MLVPQPAFALEHLDQLAARIAVARPEGQEQPGPALAVHRERTDLGIAALVQFAAERQPEQSPQRHVGRIGFEQLGGIVGIVAVRLALDDLPQLLFDLGALHRHDVLRRRKRLAPDVGLDVAHHPVETPQLGARNEGDGRALAPGAARTADAVDIALRILRQRVVDDVRKVRHVDAARRNVGGHQDVDRPVAELAQDLFALGLRHVAVQPLGSVAVRCEARRHLVRADLRAAEDDAVKIRFDVDDARQGVELVGLAHLEIDLVRQIGGQVLRLDAQHLRIAHVSLRQPDDPFGHRGREEQHAAVGARMIHDLFDIFEKTHIEHLVGLVQHQETDLVEFERAAADVVQHAARGPHDDVHAARQTAQLLAHGGPSVDGRDREPPPGVEAQELFGGLHGQFARRDEDEGLHPVGRMFGLLEYRQSESGGLARAGLGLCYDVVSAGEQAGNRESLNGCGSFEPFCADRFEHLLAEAQCAEISFVGHTDIFERSKVRQFIGFFAGKSLSSQSYPHDGPARGSAEPETDNYESSHPAG